VRVALVVIAAVGCVKAPAGPGTQPTPTPAPVKPAARDRVAALEAELERCRKAHEATKQLALALQEENARLVAQKPASPPPPRVDAEADYAELVKKAQPAIQRCYKAVPKRKAQQLTLTSTFTDIGTLDAVVVSPAISDAFEACVRKAAASWTLKVTQSSTFKTTVSLTP
jgi:hypothetical protein